MPQQSPGENSLDEPYDPYAILADPAAHPIHKMYAEINIGVIERDEIWSKCPNCGNPYQITEAWSDSTVCSDQCGKEYITYLMNPY